MTDDRIAPEWLKHGRLLYGCGCRCDTCTSSASIWRREQSRKHLATSRANGRRKAQYPKNEEQRRSNTRKAIHKAVKKGDLARPSHCQECGKDPGTGYTGQSLLFAQFTDADHPYDDLKWLCSQCCGRRRWKHKTTESPW